MSKRVCRQTSQDVCPYNVKFSEALAPDSPYAAREALGGKDARPLAREIVGMTQDEFSRAFSKSPMKRAKLRGLKRNAAVVLGNVGTPDDADVLAHALADPEPLVREHAAWALDRMSALAAPDPLSGCFVDEPDDFLREEVRSDGAGLRG